MWQTLKEDIQVVFQRDPAARNIWEVIFTYPGFHAILIYRLAHWLWRLRLTTLARFVSHVGRFLTGIEIHPGAKIGRRFFIDHGMGVVIGETSEIGDDVTLYQGVTLGGTSTERIKRHPTIEESVTIFSGAAVLGPVTVGRHSRVGAGSVLVTSVPPHSTVVGVPGRVVKIEAKHTPTGKAIIDLNSADLPDPVQRALTSALEQVERLEKRINELSARQGGLEEKQAEDNEALRKVRELIKNSGNG
ncbi:MAG: serine O-acetyltransferase [Deltaproteobacteria bacterium RIFCSPLOWO2_12_FULL_60_19]|nr:MAG: serine O-acetyltransferase [Deltaproteobacteria bacterium RIFCSPLOWO2_12_FULL_60_19]